MQNIAGYIIVEHITILYICFVIRLIRGFMNSFALSDSERLIRESSHSIISLSLALLIMLPFTGFTGELTLNSHGYLRTGYGVSNSDVQQCFKTPGAGAKFRLGNECDNYFDIGGIIKYDFGEQGQAENDLYLKLVSQFELGSPFNRQIEWLGTSQLFIELGNFSAVTGDAKVWIGRRYYERQDIHINDFFVFNFKGDGAGIMDVQTGYGKVAYAYLQNLTLPEKTGTTFGGDIRQSVHDLRWYGIPVNQNGELLIQAMFSSIEGRSHSTATISHSVRGWGLGIVHKQENLLGGENRLTLQYGKGSSRGAGSPLFENKNVLGELISATTANALKQSTTFRVTEQYLLEQGAWAWMSILLYERKAHKSFDGIDQNWISIGARPMYFINNHWRVAAEFGHDRIYDHTQGTQGGVTKGTVALELAQKKGFWERPVLRLFTTYAIWPNSLRGRVGGTPFASRGSGWNAGFQLESWW